MTSIEEYVKFLNIDISDQSQILNDVIEDIGIRLEEYKGLSNMVCTEGISPACNKIPEINQTKIAIDHLCERIDALGDLINRIQSDMFQLESALMTEEDNIMRINKPLKNIFMPFFFKKSLSEGESSSKSKSSQEPINIFKVSDYFEIDENSSTNNQEEK